MKLSIIILNFNAESFLKQCLLSLRDHQTADYEIIVVDNDSSDGSEDMVKRQFPEIKLVTSDRNLGFAGGNNLGVKEAQGQYLLFLNPDTTVPGETIPTMLAYMEAHPDVGLATCYVELAKNGQIDPACHRGFPTPWASFCYFGKLEKLFPKIKLFSGYHLWYKDLSKTHEIDSPSGTFYLVRHHVIDQVGSFCEDYFMYAEDLDLSYRIKQAGYKIMFVPDVKIIHFKGVSSGIKEHSQNVTTANTATKIRSISAFYDTMGLFYKKHLAEKYPYVLNWLVYIAITAKKAIALRSKTV